LIADSAAFKLPVANASSPVVPVPLSPKALDPGQVGAERGEALSGHAGKLTFRLAAVRGEEK
jgi:hypothetical protein